MDVNEDTLVGNPPSEVPKQEPTDEDCLGKRVNKQTGEFQGYCRATPGRGTDHVGEGRCKHHGGTNSGENGQGGTENNGNAETHGLTSDAEKWFARHREEVEDDVRLLVQSWMDRAPFGWDVHGNVWILVECAIDEVRMRQADDYVDDEGIVVSHFDGVADDGRDIIERKENPALLPKSRMKKDTMRTLKDLGILDDPDSQQAAATEDLANAWREALDS